MKKTNAISILRIIATLMVVMVHFGHSLPLPLPLYQFVLAGREGVTIFFIISGFLIANSLEKDNDTVKFFKKRAVRIIPIYSAVVIVNIIASLIIGNYPQDITRLGWLRYIFFIQAIVPTDNYEFWNNAAALWAMTSFAVFYLIAPVISAFVHKKGKISVNRSIAVLVFFVAVSVISSKLYLLLSGNWADSGLFLSERSPFSSLYKFSIGMFIYYACRDKNRIIWVAMIGIAGCVFQKNSLIIPSLLGIVFYCVMDKKFSFGEKTTKLLAKMDEYSFSVYLGHTTVMFIMSRIQENMGFSNVILAVLDLILCIIFIPLLHELIEKPCAKAGKKLLKI